MKAKTLTLSNNDPSVIAARNAEKDLFKLYGLQSVQHYITLPGQGTKVRVLEIGEGEPVFVVPGNTGDAFPLACLLAQIKGRRLIVVNRPGGGLSEGMDHTTVNIRQFAVATLTSALDAFNLTNVDVVAHSMGAHWSLWLAMDRPELVQSLSLLGNPGNVMKGGLPLALHILIYWPFNLILGKIIKGSDTDRKLTMMKTMGSSRETIDSLPAELENAYFYFKRLPYYFLSLTSLLKNAAPKIDAQQLSTVKQPAQLLLGDKDTFASVAAGQSIADAMPKCKLHVIKGASHLPWLESPVECGDIINKFLARKR